MAISRIDTAALEPDAVDNTILDVSDNYTFTGTVAGAGEAVSYGTFTPYHVSSSTSGSNLLTSGSYNTSQTLGKYARIGNIVYVSAKIKLGTKAYASPGGNSQNVGVGNLPFNIENTTYYTPTGSSAYFYTGTGWAGYAWGFYGVKGTNYGYIVWNNGNGQRTNLLTDFVVSTGEYIFDMTYITDDA